jgi:hypothetical protein
MGVTTSHTYVPMSGKGFRVCVPASCPRLGGLGEWVAESVLVDGAEGFGPF